MCFKIFGRGSHWDICFGFKVGFGSFYSDSKYGIIWPILEALDASYKIGLKMRDREEMQKHAEEFAAICPSSQEVFNGVVMAIDGLIIQTRKPLDHETPNVKSHMTRCGIWGLTVLAGCDARTKFHMWHVNSTGSNNDYTRWTLIRL